MNGKIVMVTGANSGIGRVTARELALKGATVVMVCRDEEKGEAVRDDINATIGGERTHLLLADFSNHDSIRKMSEEFKRKFTQLDVLINNAGLMVKNLEYTVDGFETMMGVNHFGYFLNTHYLLDALLESREARIVNVASMAHRFASVEWDNLNGEKNFQFFKQYSLSKLFNIFFTNHLSGLLAEKNITVNSLHPGVVNSNFGKTLYPSIVQTINNWIMISPEKGAETSIYLASSSEVAHITGTYFANCKRRFPSSLASNEKVAEKAWNWSLEKTGIHEFGVV